MKFNTQKSLNEKLQSNPNATTNEEGAVAFKVDARMELYMMATTTIALRKILII